IASRSILGIWIDLRSAIRGSFRAVSDREVISLRALSIMAIGSLTTKLRLIYLPYLMLSLSVISIYSFLHWMIFIKLELFPVREIITFFGLPALFATITVLIWLRPRIKLLKLKKEARDYDILYLGCAILLITISTTVAQDYLTTVSGTLTELTGINSIDNIEKTKYYTVKDYFVSKKNLGTHVSGEMQGRYNNKIHLSLFITLPIYESMKDEGQKIPPAWIGIKYIKELNNFLSDEELEKKFEDFLDDAQNDFDAKNVQEFVYLDRIGYSDNLDGYKEALKKSPKYHSTNDIVLTPIKTPFELRNDNKLKSVFRAYVLGSLFWLFMLLFPKFDEDALTYYLQGKSVKNDNSIREFFSTFFIPNEILFVVPILLSMLSLIFFAMFFSGYGFVSMSSDGLLRWGASYRPAIVNGEYWRLVANIFLHDGAHHLAANGLALWYVGMCLEPVLGRMMFFVFFILTGVFASLSSIYWYEATVSVGASGAILGLCGLFIALVLTKRPCLHFIDMNSPILGIIIAIVICSLGIGFLTKGIDNAAHTGGLVSGLVLGLVLAIIDVKSKILSTI
ncbi:MAG: rhomboid family intramembrane serine protease, partial [Chlamydiales bacterium]